jgi:hypothetical protein
VNFVPALPIAVSGLTTIELTRLQEATTEESERILHSSLLFILQTASAYLQSQNLYSELVP